MIDSDNILFNSEELRPIGKSYGQAIYDGLLNGGTKTAVVDAYTGKELSYSTLRVQTLTLASFYMKFGLKEDDVISICAQNSFEIFVPSIAALYKGIVVAPINPAYKPREIINILNISKPKIIFCDLETVKNVQEAIKTVSSVKKVILFGRTKNENVGNLEDLMTSYDMLDPSEILKVDPDHSAAIMCSSGTTGNSKGVLLSHKNFLITADVVSRENYFGLTRSKIPLVTLPYFHVYAFQLFNIGFVHNIKSIMMYKFNEKVFFSSIEKYKVNFLPLVPPLIVLLAKSTLVDEYDLSSVTDIICGAAPLKKDIEELVAKRLKITGIRQGYGLTETSFGITHQLVGKKKYGSVGRLVPGAKAKIIDIDTGKSLGPNQTGEICIKSPMVMKRYYGDPTSTAVMIDKEGWMHTGDLGYYDKEYSFFIVDRLRELIKFKGFQVPPAEIEGLLLTHPTIKDVAVVGKYDEICGEKPVAFVIKLPNENVTEEEIIKFVAVNMSYQKRLHGGVIFVDEIPKTPSGKILRRLLREELNSKTKIIIN